MLGILIIICSVVAMARIALVEGRSPVFWGGMTLVLCILGNMFVPVPFLNLAIGFVLSFGAMFTLNLIKGV